MVNKSAFESVYDKDTYEEAYAELKQEQGFAAGQRLCGL